MSKVDSAPAPGTARTNRKPARSGKLSAEIRMVRTLIRQAVKLTDEGTSPEELLKVLQAVSRASTNLAQLLKAEKSLEDNQSGSDYVKAALEEIRVEMERKGIDSVLTSGLG